MAQIIANPENGNWGDLIGNAQEVPMHSYTTNDQSTLSVLKNFLNSNQSTVAGIQSLSSSEMISAIQKDSNGFGFCNLAQISDPENQNLLEGLKFVPIDKNGNGKIDYMENIYANVGSLARGVWNGKYPNGLSSNIYSVSFTKPDDATEVAFLKWVLSDLKDEFRRLKDFFATALKANLKRELSGKIFSAGYTL